MQDQDIPLTGTVDGDEFRLALKRVLPAVSPGNPVPALSGILISHGGFQVELLATDKYVMSYATCPFAPVDGPHRALSCRGRQPGGSSAAKGKSLPCPGMTAGSGWPGRHAR